jgi:hypothetical protein
MPPVDLTGGIAGVGCARVVAVEAAGGGRVGVC